MYERNAKMFFNELNADINPSNGGLKMYPLDYGSENEDDIDLHQYSKINKKQIRTDVNLYVDMYRKMLHCEERESKPMGQSLEKIVYFEPIDMPGMEHRYQISKMVDTKDIRDGFDDGTFSAFNVCRIGAERGYSGRILKCNLSHVIVDIKCTDIMKEIPYRMEFKTSRLPFLMQYEALNYVQHHSLFDLLINNPRYQVKYKYCAKYEENQYGPTNCTVPQIITETDLSTNLNFEQREAIANIVCANNFPLPYLLYGPPGTGKTQTLVAAIEQIVISTHGHALVCANSNAACDEIAERLTHVLNKAQLLRFYPKSYNLKKIKPSLQKVSNVYDGQISVPELSYFYGFRVIVCTLCTAGCFTRARADFAVFNPAHFSHVIIDESASTHETMALVAIAGLCTSPNMIHSSIVLAGDPKQLSPVTKSKSASKMGFDTSLMEYLFDKPMYQRDEKNGKFNSKFITMLIQNYRSHPAILFVPNKLFYGNSLRARAPYETTGWFLESDLLPSKGFPIIFRSVQGNCKRSHNSESVFNGQEVDIVIDYIGKLLEMKCASKCGFVRQTDIGVVTPYKSQCQKIIQRCQAHGCTNVRVGTAEVYQGQEKPIMIVSVVRGGGQGLGFVSDPQRLNVIITRAKCLLIIVGDSHALSRDPHWAELIRYCEKNKALLQGDLRTRLSQNKSSTQSVSKDYTYIC